MNIEELRVVMDEKVHERVTFVGQDGKEHTGLVDNFEDEYVDDDGHAVWYFKEDGVGNVLVYDYFIKEIL